MYIDDKNIEEIFTQLAHDYKKDTKWLISRGWIKTDKIYKENGFEAAIWLSPKKKEYVHCSSLVGFEKYTKAIDRANYDYLIELGWKSITVNRINSPRSDNNIWGHLIHPVSYKLYMYLEAICIAKTYQNNEEKYLKDHRLCGKTYDLQQDLTDKNLTILGKKQINTKFVRYGSNYKWEIIDII